jgi:polyhydroxyalkanoate synthesis repressor PhaR
MPLIKRYPNRKLYNTESKSYINLEDIADLIRNGKEIQVIDHATGEDLTSVTLTQIIFEEEKKKTGFIPLAILSNLVKSGGETIDNLYKTLTGSTNWSRHVDEEIKHRFIELVDKGEIGAREAKSLVRKLLDVKSPISGIGKRESQKFLQYLEDHSVPTQAQIRALEEEIDRLAAKIDELVDD